MNQILKTGLVLCIALLLGACSSLDTKMTATADLNPDINGNPSPIAVSVFELSDTKAFIASDFIHLYANPAATLGSSLLAERNIMLVPNTTETVSLPFVKGAVALAYVAAYQDLTASNWREIVMVAPNMVQGVNIKMNLNNQGIQLVSNEPSL